ncbi:sulfite exporter TauE/SafE family protein [Actinomycetaceae bacterium MB13-C1-2]|nr:sulfite exporter TauE/SafE family protein [Actinomycetaceae bacterium MB13-C1-2]
MDNAGSGKQTRTAAQIVGLILLGIAAGFLSGMFGVGGGIIIVPGLMAIAGFSQRLASGTSLATIVPLASVGVISYASHGSVSWIGALLLALGAIAGAQLGTWLLVRISRKPLQIFFALFMVAAIVSLFMVVPSRDATLTIDWPVGIGLVALGFVTGTLSGLLGVGGGIVVVPALMLFFGVSDLIAKGTSLLVMIPTALTGTVSNFKRKNVDLAAAAIVGLPACATTYLGSLAASAAPPEIANIFFAIFLAFVAAQLLWKALRAPKTN